MLFAASVPRMSSSEPSAKSSRKNPTAPKVPESIPSTCTDSVCPLALSEPLPRMTGLTALPSTSEARAVKASSVSALISVGLVARKSAPTK